jgi:predicted kinase
VNKLLMLSGLPASGKTTYAKELVAQGWKRVNKDDLRAMIDDSKWSKTNEKEIMEARDLIVIHFLDNGYNVVVDDTNFHDGHRESLIEIADNCDAEFEEKFFDVPVYECIERDLKRGDKSVGSKVILGMYFKYLRKDVEWKENRQNAFMFDIDGTLARMVDRSPFDYTKVHTDVVVPNIAMILRCLRGNTGLPIIIMSGRKLECENDTAQWLKDNNIPFDHLIMRETEDNRKDAIIKEELYHKYVEPFYNIIGVFDDRNQVVDMWRSLGLTCLQVDYGGF